MMGMLTVDIDGATVHLTDAEACARASQLSARVVELEASHRSASLDLGRFLLQIRSRYPHGEWSLFLQRAGVNKRRAQRAMKAARTPEMGARRLSSPASPASGATKDEPRTEPARLATHVAKCSVNPNIPKGAVLVDDDAELRARGIGVPRGTSTPETKAPAVEPSDVSEPRRHAPASRAGQQMTLDHLYRDAERVAGELLEMVRHRSVSESVMRSLVSLGRECGL